MTQLPPLPEDYPLPPWLHKYWYTDARGIPTNYYTLDPHVDAPRIVRELRLRIIQMDAELATLHKYRDTSPLIRKIIRIRDADRSLMSHVHGWGAKAGRRLAAFRDIPLAYLAFFAAWGTVLYLTAIANKKPAEVMEELFQGCPFCPYEVINDTTFADPHDLAINHSEMPLMETILPGQGVAGTKCLRLQTKAPVSGERYWIAIRKFADPPRYRFLSAAILFRSRYPLDLFRVGFTGTINMRSTMHHPGIELRRDEFSSPLWFRSVPTSYAVPRQVLCLPSPYLYYLTGFSIDVMQGTYVSANMVNTAMEPRDTHYPISGPQTLAETQFGLYLHGRSKRRVSIDIDRFLVVSWGDVPILEPEPPTEQTT